ncbi:hypothetical protein J6590_086532 [Homalodisca vitripennis]|nr:hypothetical protein J6590_086532 [Homalodisca vitripennis]
MIQLLCNRSAAALGDLQCSVLATLRNSDDAVLNISTSAQLAFVAAGFNTDQIDSTSPVEYFPYFEGKYLAVATALNGGNALATFVQMLQQWTLDLGFNMPQSAVWNKLLDLGSTPGAESTLCVVPTLLGERHSPQQNASISNIDPGSLHLGQVFKAICRGIVENLHSMMPREMLLKANISRILGIGSALMRNQVLQCEVRQCYQLPVVFVPGGDAAWGAAMAVHKPSNSL